MGSEGRLGVLISHDNEAAPNSTWTGKYEYLRDPEDAQFFSLPSVLTGDRPPGP